jgi:DNA-binding MarR family transcriptional regulator
VTDRAPGDDVAGITAQWARERPELDVTPIEVFGRIAKLHRAQIEASEHAYRQLGISASDFDVLATLRRAGRPYRLTPSELTSSMMISSGGVTQRVDRLERVGLVERRPHESDRRSTTVALTPGGRRLIDKAMPLHLDAERTLLVGLSKADRTALAKLLKKALANSE